jgi:hypothetical protein
MQNKIDGYGAMVGAAPLQLSQIAAAFARLTDSSIGSSKSSLKRKINHERVHLQLQLDASGGANPISSEGPTV